MIAKGVIPLSPFAKRALAIPPIAKVFLLPEIVRLIDPQLNPGRPKLDTKIEIRHELAGLLRFGLIRSSLEMPRERETKWQSKKRFGLVVGIVARLSKFLGLGITLVARFV